MWQIAVALVAVVVILWYYGSHPAQTEGYHVRTHHSSNKNSSNIQQDQDLSNNKREMLSDHSLHRAKFQRMDAPSGPSKIGIRDNSTFTDTEYLVFEKKLTMG